MKFSAVLLKILGVVALSLFLLSCGETGRSHHRVHPGVLQYEFSTPQEAKSQYDSWEVSCLDALKCPESVGQLLVLETARISICTATLISEDEILTNSHCFDLYDSEDRLIPAETMCQNGASIVFASNSALGRDQVKCKKVLKKSLTTEVGFNADYMILKLEKKLKRNFDSVSRAGLSDRQKLTIRVVNPKSRGLGEVEVKDCEVLHATSLLPTANRPDFYLHVLKGCEMIHGNSGSSLVDYDGKIRGLFFAGVTPKDTSLMSTYERKLFYKALEVKASLVTNTTCIDHPFAGQGPISLEKCAQDRKAVGTIKNFVDTAEFQRQLQNQALEQSLDLPNELGYKLFFQPERLNGFYSPNCVKRLSGSSTPLQNARESSLIAPIFIWSADLGFNDRLKPVFSFSTDIHNCHIRWSPRDLTIRGQTSVNMTGNYCFDSRGNQGRRKDTWTSCDP